ncbi:MAG: hypothetical protein AAF371_01560 [Pseudomonadota bacterium]
MNWLNKVKGEQAALLDTAYLDRLRHHLGEEVVDELLSDGELELTDKTAQLGRQAAESDAEGMRRVSHDLIAVAGHLGLSALSLAAVELNRNLRKGRDCDRLEALAAPVIALAERSLGAMTVHRDGGAGT